MISVDKLKKLNKTVIYNFVIYNSEKQKIIDIFAISLYQLNWDHLTIQNLGTGQLQIKDMKNFIKSPKTTMLKKEWQLRLKKEVIAFYDKLIIKTKKRQEEWQ